MGFGKGCHRDFWMIPVGDDVVWALDAVFCCGVEGRGKRHLEFSLKFVAMGLRDESLVTVISWVRRWLTMLASQGGAIDDPCQSVDRMGAGAGILLHRGWVLLSFALGVAKRLERCRGGDG